MKPKRKNRDKEIDKRWDIKMIRPVMEFVFDIKNHLNPRIARLAKKDEYLYDGPEIEAEVWKLLNKVRRMTLLEKKK